MHTLRAWRNITGSSVDFYLISISCYKAAECLVKNQQETRHCSKKAGQVGRLGNHRNRVPLTDDAQQLKISDSRKLPCTVQHNHPFFPLMDEMNQFECNLSLQGHFKDNSLTLYILFLNFIVSGTFLDTSFSIFVAHLYLPGSQTSDSATVCQCITYASVQCRVYPLNLY